MPHPQQSSKGGTLQGNFAGRIPRFIGNGPASATLQMRGNASELPDSFMQQLGHSRGQSMPEPVQQKMESALGADFSSVRIHIGHQAPSIGALAFTLGSDIYFAPGLYDPNTVHGQRLLGHELTHVVQQRAGRVSNPYGSGLAVVQDPGLEAEADRMGMIAAAHTMPPSPASSSDSSPIQPKAPHGAAAISSASHVQAAIGFQMPGGPRPAQAKPDGYRLVVGSYMHNRRPGAAPLPEDLAGHSFVSIQGPGGRNQTWGFSPKEQFDPQSDLGRLRTGVQGKVHHDADAFAKPGVRTRSFEITGDQARAASNKVTEYRSRGNFSLQQRQCTHFALDVARAAGVDAIGSGSARSPRDLFRKL